MSGRSRPPAAPLLRVLPVGGYAGRARMLVVRSALAYRRAWPAFVSGFFESVFYRIAMGQGLGSLVGALPGAGRAADQLRGGHRSRAARRLGDERGHLRLNLQRLLEIEVLQALRRDAGDSVGPVDIALGEIGWALLRGGLYSVGFLAVMLGFGLLASPWALLALPAALLVAFAFAAVGMAATSFMRPWQDFDLIQLVIMPMFLFATTFFPLSVYPRAVQIVVEFLPLFHAVELMRGLTTGVVGVALIWHASYFVVTAAIGVLIVRGDGRDRSADRRHRLSALLLR